MPEVDPVDTPVVDDVVAVDDVVVGADERSRLLLVDDERAVVDGLRRLLGREYAVTTATSGAEALALMASGPQFDVIVSDMRMPEMDGAAFLARARAHTPDSARILLTGQTDITSAMAAVNNGAIFRFLAKPCDIVELRAALVAGVRQVQLTRAERELLDNTLTGSVQLLTDVLELAVPSIFARSRRITRIARHIAARVAPPSEAWSFELAARLAHIGCVALPAAVVERAGHRAKLTPAELDIWKTHPATAARLISSIPRLRTVAEMVRRQQQIETRVVMTDVVALGAATLRLSIDLDTRLALGDDLPKALAALARTHDQQLLRALLDFDRREAARSEAVSLVELQPEMVLEEALQSRSGTMILAAGTELTAVMLERLRNFANNGGCREPIRVRVPG